MMNVGLHCRIVGKPGRAPALDRFLAHVKQKPDVWVTTRAEIARHWRAEHPPALTPAHRLRVIASASSGREWMPSFR